MPYDAINARRRIDKAKTDTEKAVGNFLVELGFELVDVDAEILNKEKKKIGELDLIFRFEDYLLLVEVNGEKNAGSEKIDHFFSRWETRENFEQIFKKYGLEHLKVIRIYFEQTKPRPEKKSGSLDHKTSNKENTIVYKDDFEYFQNNARIIGKWEKNDFIDYLGVELEEASRRIPAIQTYISNEPAFIFAEKIENLLKACYISRRRTCDNGYQRAIDETRIPKISRDIERGKTIAFPNSIIISCTTKIVDTVIAPEKCPASVKINFPSSYCSSRVVDGQHRLLAFSKLEQSALKDHSLPVIAFQELSPQDETRMFIDINSKQKRIDSNLILLLKSDFTWPEGTREFWEKIAVKVFIKMNKDEPLKDRIYLGTASEKPGNKLRLTTLISATLSNQFIGGKNPLFQTKMDDEVTPHKKISEIFRLMGQHLKNYYFGSHTPFFVENRGIRITFRLVKIIEKNRLANRIKLELADFFRDLGTIVDDDFRKKLEDYYGEGGANRAVDLIIQQLKEKKSEKYKSLETDLRSLS